MAQKITDPKERDRRVKLIGDYYKNHDTSIRKTASYFTKNFFSISIYTVKDYLERYKIMFPKYKKIIEDKLNNNKPVSIDDENVKTRVMEAARLFKLGLFVDEVANRLGISNDVAYRDLVERLPKINLQEAKEVAVMLNHNRYSNLIHSENFKKQDNDYERLKK